MRFATGVDDDFRPFHDAFRDDPVIGKAVRAHPHLRVRRRPVPWEALLAAITEQLIEFERAVAIQRRMIAALGVRCAATGLRDGPCAATVAAAAPARLASFDLAPKRALALHRAAREVAAGRADLDGAMGTAPGAGRGGRAAAAHDPRDRPVDGRDPRALRARAARHRPGRRPRVHQDGRAPAHRQPARARGGRRGARVLRALRGVEGARLRVPPVGLGARADQCSSPEIPGSSPSPGRNSLVSARPAFGGCVSSPFCSIQRP